MSNEISITFLGTSDQIPSAKRNHTSILISYTNENILIDCGEGTQRQFRIAKINLCKLTKILITHWHGDHVLGLPGLLQTLALNGYNKTLEIYGPKKTKKFVEEMLALFNFQREYTIKVFEIDSGVFFDSKEFYLEAKSVYHGIPCNAYNFVKKGQLKINKSQLKKCKLPEGPHLQKLKEGKDILFEGKKYLSKNLTYFEDEKKVSFLLDTSFDESLISFVSNADFFISECSFGDELEEHAMEHKHLISKQVSEIAKRGKVQKLILTHISQRYENDLSKISKQISKNFKKVFVAKDFDFFILK